MLVLRVGCQVPQFPCAGMWLYCIVLEDKDCCHQLLQLMAQLGAACADKSCPEHLLRQSPCVNVVWSNAEQERRLMCLVLKYMVAATTTSMTFRELLASDTQTFFFSQISLSDIECVSLLSMH